MMRCDESREGEGTISKIDTIINGYILCNDIMKMMITHRSSLILTYFILKKRLEHLADLKRVV